MLLGHLISVSQEISKRIEIFSQILNLRGAVMELVKEVAVHQAHAA